MTNGDKRGRVGRNNCPSLILENNGVCIPRPAFALLGPSSRRPMANDTPHRRGPPANARSCPVGAVPSGGHRQEHQQRDKWRVRNRTMGPGTPDLRAARTRPRITPDHQAIQRPTTRETRTVPPRTHHGSRQKQERYSRPLRCAGESPSVKRESLCSPGK